MCFTRLQLVVSALAIAAVIGSPWLESKGALPDDDASIVHALNRLTFGATVRDLERVRRMGLARWIDEQLAPEAIDDDELHARLARFETLALSSDVIDREYDRPAREERLRAQRPFDSPAATAGSLRASGRAREDASTAPAMRPSESTARPAAPRESGDARRTARPQPTEAQRRSRLVLSELSEAKLLRAIYSERQLEEVLVDFWFNHFNVFAGKGRTRVYVTEYERAAIRPHVLGRFRDLLGATAKSPAMLFYLDNWMSSAPLDSSASATPRRMRGLNENYARELLELHTLGVDGGYTQEDIVDVARAFTGWTIRRRAPRSPLRASRFGAQAGGQAKGRVDEDGGGFRFVPAMHDAGEKTVLGHTIGAGGGERDGERVLDILAAHPSTARFIATKLARRFVSDQPPQALIDRAAARFRATDGNLREVVRTIVTSPELFSDGARGAKVKTPLELVVSALRATGADVAHATSLTRVLRDLGMPVYFCQPPTGYDDTGDTWVSSGALVGRMNFAVDLTSGRLRGVRLRASRFRPRAARDGGQAGGQVSMLDPGTDLQALRDEAHRTLLFGRAGEATLSTIARATTPAQTLALAVGSPEFQRK